MGGAHERTNDDFIAAFTRLGDRFASGILKIWR
jgi:hypothetical protein